MSGDIQLYTFGSNTQSTIAEASSLTKGLEGHSSLPPAVTHTSSSSGKMDHVYYRWTRSIYRSTVDRYIGRLSVDCRSTIDRLSIDYRSTVDRHSTDSSPIYRSTVDRCIGRYAAIVCRYVAIV